MTQASAEKVKQTGAAEKDGLSATKRAVGKNVKVAFAEGKRNRAICPDRHVVSWESQDEQELPFEGREEDRSESMGENRVSLHNERKQIPRRRGRASKENLPRRSRRKHERVSGCKSSPGTSAKSWFYFKSGQI